MKEIISLVEYARMHGIHPDTARQRASRGAFKTARKIGRNWVIEKDEEFIDNRFSQGYIYIIKNDVNDKVYIGQTYVGVERRFRQHCTCADSIIDKEMKKIGLKHFWVEKLDEAGTLEEMAEKEQYYISKYNAISEGYNRQPATLQTLKTINERTEKDRIVLCTKEDLKTKLTEKANAENRSLNSYITNLLRKDVEKK